MAWGLVDHNLIFIFGWTIPLKVHIHNILVLGMLLLGPYIYGMCVVCFVSLVT